MSIAGSAKIRKAVAFCFFLPCLFLSLSFSSFDFIYDLIYRFLCVQATSSLYNVQIGRLQSSKKKSCNCTSWWSWASTLIEEEKQQQKHRFFNWKWIEETETLHKMTNGSIIDDFLKQIRVMMLMLVCNLLDDWFGNGIAQFSVQFGSDLYESEFHLPFKEDLCLVQFNAVSCLICTRY